MAEVHPCPKCGQLNTTYRSTCKSCGEELPEPEEASKEEANRGINGSKLDARTGLLWVLGAPILLLAGVIAQDGVRRLFEQVEEPVNLTEALQHTAEELNRRAPIAIDRETELFNAEARGATLIYNYRLLNRLASEVSEAELERGLRPVVMNAACTNPETRYLLDLGVTLRYRYLGKYRGFISMFDVTPTNCGPP